MPDTTDPLLATNGQPIPATGRSPHEVLEAKAESLTQRTGGILVGDLRTRKDENATMISFGARVPALGGGRQGILTAVFPNDRAYPAWIHAACFPRSLSIPPYAILTPEQQKEEFVSFDAERLGQLVEHVLQSDDMAPVLKKLIATATQRLSQSKDASESNGS
jgi:hypothetical protein